VKAARRTLFGGQAAKAKKKPTTNMKEKSSKQSKKDKPAVQIKDLKPAKDAQGQKRLMASRDILRIPGGLPRL
jgi:hypothetical protein